MSQTDLIRPAVHPVKPGNIPEASVLRLDNKVPVYSLNAGTEDIVRIEFIFQAGNIMENIPLLASSTNSMLSEGTRNLTSNSINKQLDFYGTFYNLYTDRDTAGLVLFALKKHLKRILEVVGEMLFYPIFPASELKALLKKRHRSYLVSREKVQNIAMDKFFESVFGSDHPYGRQVTSDDFGNLIPKMLRDFHRKFYSPRSMAVIVSGKTDDRVYDLLNKVAGAVSMSGTSAGKPAGPDIQKKVHVHIPKDGAVQTAIRIGSATINKRHPDYPGLKITDMVLGGYFGSRLMRNLREEKGYTYGINSAVTSLNFSGFNVISAEVSKKNTQKAIHEIVREIELLQSVPPGKKELMAVRSYMLGEMVRMFDGPFAIAESFRSAWQFGLDNSYYLNLAEKIRTIEADEITSLAKTYYRTDDLNIITAG